MKTLAHPLVFLIFYVLLQTLNSLYSCLNGYETTEIKSWIWIDWMLKCYIPVSIAGVGAVIAFFDQKLSRWRESQATGSLPGIPSEPEPPTAATTGKTP